ncbi:putative RNA-binding protein [Thermoplasmatales archaeon BRNA1]|nr:putative RNA-binding protein [Thermoplasmatales archaeon BRNA1]
MEEYAYVLDYLPNGIPGGKYDKAEPLVYALGESEFKLFELVAKPNVSINFEDRVYIGKDSAKRDVIDHVKRRVNSDDISSTAHNELEYAVKMIVENDVPKFIAFFNNAGPITLKKHALEELPGLGKKSMLAILDERKKGNFKDFEDLAARVPSVKQPEKLIIARIVLEIEDPNRKRYIFAKDRATERRY